ncbi:hypothetical protein FHETE_5684 [Fusarium heterosporum]|uniref:Uncharacterized protein n=1 Tax=Fusarium heterosporum TaxID=42747 RepID=A0A8H5TDD6_FUSHE|nr:hypothetical protein FHETE_5684 [Fusarium heterosporum]
MWDYWDQSTNHHILNARVLRMATRLHHIQTKILHLPHRFSSISSGPPPRQVEEFGDFVAHSGAVFFLSVGMGALAIWLSVGNEARARHTEGLRFWLEFVTLVYVTFAILRFLKGHYVYDRTDWGTWEVREKVKAKAEAEAELEVDGNKEEENEQQISQV